MSRVGIFAGQKYTFTHINPQTGEWYCSDIGKNGSWIDSKMIDFDIETKKKRKNRFFRKER